jgi:flagellar motility protein MotE (MotC chaperone)
MKKLLTVLMLTLALNFLASVGAIGYLFKTGGLNKEKIAAIKAVMYPATTQAVGEDKNDVPDATTQPTLRLEKLLASVSGRPAGEQVEFMQRTFDAQTALLDRRQRDLADVLSRIQSEQAKLEADRTTMLAERKKLDEREKALKDQTEDKGFEDSLTLYDSMPTKQVKDVFATLDDATVTKYLRAMDASRAAKVLKEFKTPQETDRVQHWMEQIRQTPADDKTAAAAASPKQ